MSPPFFSFTVVGHPEPAGSKRAFQRGGRIVVVDDNPKSRVWKETVALVARAAMQRAGWKLLEGPLWVEMTFRRARPKSHFRTNGELSLEGLRNEYPATKPDALKLARAVEDSLSGIAYRDDALIVSERLRKEWGVEEGVTVTLMPL